MLFTISYPFGELLSESSVTMWWWWGEAGSNCDNGVVMRTGAQPIDAGPTINLSQPWSNPVSIRQCVQFTVSIILGHVCQLLMHPRLIIWPNHVAGCDRDHQNPFYATEVTLIASVFCDHLINSVQFCANVQFCAICAKVFCDLFGILDAGHRDHTGFCPIISNSE